MYRSCTLYNINELIKCDLTITVPETSFNDLSSNIYLRIKINDKNFE